MTETTDSGALPEEIKRRRAFANALLLKALKGEPIQHWTQGAAQMTQALVGGLMARQAADEEKKQSYDYMKSFGLTDAAPPQLASDNPVSNLFGSGKYALPSLLSGGKSEMPRPAVAAFDSPVSQAAASTPIAPSVSQTSPIAIAIGNQTKQPPPGVPLDITAIAQRKAPSQFEPMIAAAAKKHGVNPQILSNLLYQESGFDPNTVGPQTRYGTAKGIAQFIDSTAKERGVDPFNPESAIPGAASYLAENKSKFGNPGLALAAYNWGPGNVQNWLKAGADPSRVPEETRNYVRNISGKDISEFVDASSQPVGAKVALALGEPRPNFADRFSGQPQPPLGDLNPKIMPTATPTDVSAARVPGDPNSARTLPSQVAQGLSGIGAQGMQPPQLPVQMAQAPGRGAGTPMPQARPQGAPPPPPVQLAQAGPMAGGPPPQGVPGYPAQPGIQNLAQGVQGGPMPPPGARPGVPPPQAPARPPMGLNPGSVAAAGRSAPPVAPPAPPPAAVPQQGRPHPLFGNLSPEDRKIVAMASDPRLQFAPPTVQAMVKAKAAELLKSDKTDDIKEYNLYVQQERAAGRKPEDFTPWMRGNKKSGASSVTVDQRQDNEFGKVGGKLQADRLGEIVKGGYDARGLEADFGFLRDIGLKLATGKGAEVKAALGPYAEALGIKIDGLGEMQAFNAVVARMAPRMRPPGSGATSDFEGKQFLRSLPSLANTLQGNEVITRTFEAVVAHKVKAAEIANRAFAGEIKPHEAEKAIRDLPNPYEFWKKATGFKSVTDPVDAIKQKYGLD